MTRVGEPEHSAVPVTPPTSQQHLARWRDRARWRHGAGWLLAWLAFLPVLILRAGTFNDSDIFWQIRTGLLTIADRAIPATDPFSWTVHGRPWTLNSWGFNVAVAAAYRLAGLPGVAWACVGFGMAAAAVILLLASRLGAGPVAAGAVLVLSSVLVIRWLQARPELADYVALPALVILLRDVAAGRGRIARLILASVLAAIWVNLHAAALFGVAVAGACAAVLLARRATRPAGWWCAALTLAALAGSLLNPYGAGLIEQTVRVRSASTSLVTEWGHINPADPAQVAAITIGAAALYLAIRRRDTVLAVALAVAGTGAVAVIRLQPFLVLLAVPLLAAAFSSPLVRRYARSRRAVLIPGAAVLMSVLGFLAAPSLAHLGRPNPSVYAYRPVAAIPPGCRLFNSYLIGGFVILRRPGVLVSLDSRNDLYGTARVRANERVLTGRGDLGTALAGAGCVLVPPTSGLAHRLNRSKLWTVRAADRAAVLFVRR